LHDALPICDVFGVDEEAVLAERLLTEDSQDPEWFRSEAVCQKLAARVIRFEAGLETRLLFKKQRRVYSTLRRQRQRPIASQIVCFGTSKSVSGKQFHNVVRKSRVGFKATASDRLVRICKAEVSG